MVFDRLLRKHFWVVTGFGTVGVAFFSAQAVTSCFATQYAAGGSASAQAPPGPPIPATLTQATVSKATSAEAILRRNPFDSVTGPLNKPPPGPEEDAGPPIDTSDPMNDPSCDGVKVLVIAASTDPDYSFASLQAGEKPMLRRRGGEVSGKTVQFIGWDRVWLMNGSQRCQSLLYQPPVVAPAAATASIAPAIKEPPHPSRGGVPQDISKGIQRLSATEFNVDRSALDKIFEQQADLLKYARSQPQKDDSGKVIGQKLFGVRPDTLLGNLGFEQGDVLQKVNGIDVSGPEGALEAYGRLRSAPNFTVSVQRNGKTQNLDYHVK